MRINYPRNWNFMTKEAQKQWMETTGKKQIEVYEKYAKLFSRHLRKQTQTLQKPKEIPL